MIGEQIAPGLERWSAAHPEWDPNAEPGSSADWERDVGCVLFEVSATVVLIDPLLPSEGREEFLQRLDRQVAGRPVSILTTIRWHRRDRAPLAARYRSNSTRAWNAIPPGVVQRPLRGAGETLFWLPSVEALVAGDRLIGTAGGGLELCPESWLEPERVDRAGLAALLRPLLTLPIRRVLVSHGPPVLRDGRRMLDLAVERAADQHASRPTRPAAGERGLSRRGGDGPAGTE